MKKVITYGTYDMLHFGHIRLLERAKALGDYLIVGVTSDDYDKTRGKINNQQSLNERIEAIRATGIADQIIIEEYEGQKIADIKKYNVDIFTVGSDWEGKFDYLNEYCKVIYLERTKGVSSSELRTIDRKLRIGFYGNNESRILNKYCNECQYVNGAEISGICTSDEDVRKEQGNIPLFDSFEELLSSSDAIYIISHPRDHYHDIKKALEAKCHVLVELPVALNENEVEELCNLAIKNDVILMPAMKTAYATAYNRMVLLIKAGRIGKVVSVDATCTSIRDVDARSSAFEGIWNSICAWGPTAMLPIFHILGTEYTKTSISSYFLDEASMFDQFTRIDFTYPGAVATLKAGRGVKSEGDLVVSGTEGYIYVPSPWWKTDYFEIRYENPENNRRYFYQLDGEGIRYELVEFIKEIRNGSVNTYISGDVAKSITRVIEQFYKKDINILR